MASPHRYAASIQTITPSGGAMSSAETSNDSAAVSSRRLAAAPRATRTASVPDLRYERHRRRRWPVPGGGHGRRTLRASSSTAKAARDDGPWDGRQIRVRRGLPGQCLARARFLADGGRDRIGAAVADPAREQRDHQRRRHLHIDPQCLGQRAGACASGAIAKARRRPGAMHLEIVDTCQVSSGERDTKGVASGSSAP